jgi:hypothetical protein
MKYVNLTPRWTEILPTWLMMFEQAITGDCTNPDLVRANAKEELRRMAEAADKWNDIVAALRARGWSDETFESVLENGRALNETARTTEHEDA